MANDNYLSPRRLPLINERSPSKQRRGLTLRSCVDPLSGAKPASFNSSVSLVLNWCALLFAFAAVCLSHTLSCIYSSLSVSDAIRFGFQQTPVCFKLERSRTLESLCLCGCELPGVFFARHRSICRKWDYGGMGVRVTRFVTPIDTFERIQGPMEKFLSLTHTQCEKCLLKVYK